MRRETYRSLLELLFEALPAGDEVVALSIDTGAPTAANEAGPIGAGVVVRATTFGVLSESDRERFASWPRGRLLKHWVGSVYPGAPVRLHLHSVDRPPG